MQTMVTIDEDLARTQAKIPTDIHRAGLSMSAVDVPADLKVADVFDPDVSQWPVQKQDAQ